jgi:thiamine-phosphate pyrophosphorylase
VAGSVPRLYIITDRHATGGRPLGAVVRAALAAPVPRAELAVQLREKDLGGAALTALARELRAVTAEAGVALYVNDRVDVAMAVGADGVHLGGGSLPAADVARIAPALAIAVSAHDGAEIAAAAAAPGVRFAVFGPVFETPSKIALGAPLGPGALRAAAAAAGKLPVLALGGVSPDRTAECVRTGAYGVACIRAVMASPDPAATVCDFFRGF